MAKFVKHTKCPQCGSRDNLGVYSDDSKYCFGCGYTERGDHVSAIRESNVEERNSVSKLPADAGFDFSADGVRFLRQYAITVEEAISRGIKWSEREQQLIFSYYDREGNLACVQARNFNPYRVAKAKYYNQGSPKEVLPIYKNSGARSSGLVSVSRRLVITEDTLSAVCIARQSDAMPALGTYVPVQKIMALAGLYEFIVVWLDHDKWREAREIADNCKWVGLSARTVFSELDPKCYSNEEITEYLK